MKLNHKWGAAALILGMAMPQFAVAQDDLVIKLGGRLHVDYVTADADDADFEFSGTALRRARLKGHGQFGDNLKFKIETTFDEDGAVNLEDAIVTWQPDGSLFSFKIGHFKTQNSLEEAASSLDTAIIERAAFTDAFELDRRFGFEIATKSDNYLLQLGIFGENQEQVTENGNEGFAVAGRAAYKFDLDNASLPDGSLIHIGGSFRYRDQNDAEDLRYRQRPFIENTGRIISTGRVADSDTFYGGELAGLFGPAWFQAEYALIDASCADDVTVCTDDPQFNAWSVGAGYFFGGHRNYSIGKFKRPTIDNPVTDGGWGAVSVNVRYDTLDLNDEGIQGGELDTFAAGANWWLHKNVRLQFNYFNSDATLSGLNTGASLGIDDAFAPIQTTDGNLIARGFDDDNVSGFITRLQFDF
ncbi:MAG: porin [Litorimonas sp.]